MRSIDLLWMRPKSQLCRFLCPRAGFALFRDWPVDLRRNPSETRLRPGLTTGADSPPGPLCAGSAYERTAPPKRRAPALVLPNALGGDLMRRRRAPGPRLHLPLFSAGGRISRRHRVEAIDD